MSILNTLNNITSILPLSKLFIGLFHFHESLQVFSQREYPAQFVLICIFMAQLFRERTYIMMDGRSYIVKNGLVCYSIITLAFNIQTLHYTSEFAGGIYSIWDRPTSASDAYIHHAKCPARWKKKRSRSSRRFSGAIPTIRFTPRYSLLGIGAPHLTFACYTIRCQGGWGGGGYDGYRACYLLYGDWMAVYDSGTGILEKNSVD